MIGTTRGRVGDIQCFEGVYTGTSDFTLLQCPYQGCPVYMISTCRINKACGRLHLPQGSGIDDVVRLGGEGQMPRHVVGMGQQRHQID